MKEAQECRARDPNAQQQEAARRGRRGSNAMRASHARAYVLRVRVRRSAKCPNACANLKRSESARAYAVYKPCAARQQKNAYTTRQHARKPQARIQRARAAAAVKEARATLRKRMALNQRKPKSTGRAIQPIGRVGLKNRWWMEGVGVQKSTCNGSKQRALQKKKRV